MKIILCLHKVSHTYHTKQGETLALKDISFCLNDGEFLSIVGPSGCGKTTILSLISGLIRASEGKILIDGNEVTTTNRDTGYMFQRDQLFEWRTIRQNITLGLEIQKKMTPENLKAIDELIEKYGLKEFSDHYPRELSGGMRQRVALIRTLATSPKLLLLDEPFSALDFQTRLKVCDDVYSIIKNEKKSAILVTHDISEAISMSDRILMLTNRPATIAHEYVLDMGECPTPLKRRECKKFGYWFDKIWKDLESL
ncbi:MAG TPA: ABC transporter ATP-binding protein [Clostridia bacterium]